ncbi:MAG: GatB/YqeY domain-containing protein, partial [Bdellovibrionota bacterium]
YEISVFKTFLPQALTEAELLAETKAALATLQAAGQLPAGNAGMGALMKATMARVGARAEGKAVQAAVKTVLG